MLFNSVGFFIFFLAVGSLYFLISHRFRWILLLAGSYYFYMCWKAEYAILISISTVTAYFCALYSGRTRSQRKKKFLLIVSLSVNLGLLFGFKYFNFFSDSVRAMFARFAISVDMPILRVLLPVGISFYTFQTLSYSIDVYRGKVGVEKHLGIFALYVSFFPQLVAGPIERASNLLWQFRKEHEFDFARLSLGVQLIFWGLFKKVVIADRLGFYVDSVYNNAQHHTGLSFIVATYFFAFQIYCDFSGYSDIAIGSAKVLGFDLMKNFNRPYFATTVADFWHRWHISLSTWLRDYLYIPLGGNRTGRSRMYVNLMITMFLGGIWHGANYTFLIWGVLHGLLLLISRMTLDFRDRMWRRLGLRSWIVGPVRIFLTFQLVCFCWIFFRANTLSDAFYIVGHLFSGWPRIFIEQLSMVHGLPAILILIFVQILQRKGELGPRVLKAPLVIRWCLYFVVLFGIVLFGVGDGADFIYFQF